ncbi:MarR family transcriptional regulator [uncultured Schumannella sp.]|uniref:arsenate reductase/protein-tyrosine-phosphatase family protein n=1 Tax=uncultured Schumannella sp. TaxID=1195956 RepID=UPI0025FE334C|nr:MarR family transcriptional regulator [uncultured Schumannella sp.]
MKTERNDLQRRAARHAALSDVNRLHIVDLLTLGDQSPTELQSALGLSSSLLAHHLNLLEQEGIVRRSKSEADGRRSYVRLVPGALENLGPTEYRSVRRVVFVCRGNSARSQLAAALWHSASEIPVASAGTHPADRVAPRAVSAGERRGLAIGATPPRSVDDVLAPDDFVIAVCDDAHEELSGIPALHWSVPDPVRVGTDQAFDNAFDDLASRIRDLAPRLTAA